MRLLATGLLLLVVASDPPPAASQIVLNEYLAANAFGIEDEDGDHEDWLELYNAGAASVELTGLALSDDVSEPFKWTFPRTVIAPASFLLVFASDKNRRVWAGHLETVIDRGNIWKYRVGVSEPPSTWRTIGFDDSSWDEGPSGFGYGDGDDATIIPQTISLYIRKPFTVDDPANVIFILLHVDYDDGFVAYLNDVEIARAMIGEPGDHPLYDQPASGEHEARMYQGLAPEVFPVAGDPATLLQQGVNVLSIQAHNISPDSLDMSMIPFLTLGLVAPPPDPTGTPEVLNLRLPNLHTNFKIDPAGETVTLRDASGQLVDWVDTGPMVTDVSRGRRPDGAAEWFFFTEPTPGEPNASPGYPGFAPDPIFSLPAGFYSGGVTVRLTNPHPEAVTYYTTDGGDPTISSHLYSVPVNIDSTRVLRARSFAPGLAPSTIQTRTYFIDEQLTLPVVSLATDPPNLWDEDIGIYAFGRNYNPIPPYYGANFWQDWERPIHVEYFDANGTPGFRLAAGVKIHGNYSRSFPQKSLLILARSAYGTEEIDYPLFDERENTRFKRIILRNSGNDWCLSMFRDAFCHRLAQRADLERMAYSPSIVFINRQYWGIHNIREQLDEHYLQTYFGVDPDQLDILEDDHQVVLGDAAHYQQMLDFIEDHDLSLDENYRVVQTMMETNNFAEYCVFEIYLSNQDWPWTNIKYWRPRTAEGRWRWLYFDLDRTFGNYTVNQLARATDPNGPGGVFPWANFLLVNLLKNEGFKHTFINSYADHLNTTFETSAMLAHRDQFRSSLTPEVERHYARWGWPMGSWYNHLSIISTFITQRPAYATSHILNKFALPGTLTLFLGIDPPSSGRIRLTSITIDSGWSGTYFLTVPIPLTAVPAPGYVFAGWSDPDLPQEPSVTIDPGGNYGVTARFTPAAGGIVINEINYNSAPDFDPEDWVEFHNSSAQPIDMSGWEFKDEDDAHVFTFPTASVLPAGGYLVLCGNQTLFTARFPGVTNYVGNMPFGLSGSGELLRLYDASGVLVDWLIYDDEPPWPPEPDGQGPTLELIDASADNALAENWAASIAAHGTPGALNSVAGGTGIEAGTAAVPLRLELLGGYPNPFNPTTALVFGLPDRSLVRLSVHDTTGRLVKLLIDRQLEPGWHKRTWDGRSEQGQRVASGLYFVELRADGRAIRQKLVLLK